MTTAEKVFDVATAAETLARPNAKVEVPFRGRAGAHVVFDNGWVVSIQWHAGTYSDNHHRLGIPNSSHSQEPLPTSLTAECAVWTTTSDGFLKWEDGDTVQGWLTFDQVQALLDLAAADAIREPVTVAPKSHKEEGNPDV